MSERWPRVRLGEILVQDRDYVTELEPRLYPKLSVKLYGRGVCLDSPTDGASVLMNRHQLAKPGQVILSEIWAKKGAIGLVPSSGAGALVTSHFFLFDVRCDRAIPDYVDWLLRANYFEAQMSPEARGTTGYAAIRPAQFLSCEIPLPPVPEQRRIVARIEEVAGKIGEVRALRSDIVGKVRLLSRSAVSQTLGRMQPTGRIGEILLDKPRNGWSARCDNAEDGTPVLTLSAVTGFRYCPTAFKRTSEPTSASAHYWLEVGDLLITRSNTPELVGHAAIYDGNPSPCIYSDLMMKLTVNQRIAETRFVWMWLQTDTAREYISRHAKGSSPSMKKISQGEVMEIPFPVATPLSEQRRIVEELDALQTKIDPLSRLQARTTTELDALLPAVLDRAFRGEL